MTIKLKEQSTEDCLWTINILSNLARYTYTQKKYFEPFQFVAGNGNLIHHGIESAITSLLITNDTEIEGINTVHGKVDFMQLVGITQQELEYIKENRTRAITLVENMKKDNPHLVTDMTRKKSYL